MQPPLGPPGVCGVPQLWVAPPSPWCGPPWRARRLEADLGRALVWNALRGAQEFTADGRTLARLCPGRTCWSGLCRACVPPPAQPLCPATQLWGLLGQCPLRNSEFCEELTSPVWNWPQWTQMPHTWGCQRGSLCAQGLGQQLQALHVTQVHGALGRASECPGSPQGSELMGSCWTPQLLFCRQEAAPPGSVVEVASEPGPSDP